MTQPLVTVLVVDDEPGVRHVLCDILGELDDTRILSAASGEDAQQVLQAEPVDVVVTDLSMPGISGLDLMDWGQQHTPGKTWVILTGRATLDSAVRAVRLGAYEFLYKPLQSPEALLTVVRNALRQRQLKAENDRLRDAIEQRSLSLQQQVSRDLHEGIAQTLAGIALLAETLQRGLRQDPTDCHPLSEQAARLAQLAKEAISETRSLAMGLSPVPSGPDGLSVALRRQAQRVTRDFGVDCHFEALQPVAVEDARVAYSLYQIAQEAITNALRHGQPTEIVITLGRQNGRVGLMIEDNGTGLSSSFEEGDDGLGLRMMRYRAHQIGGQLQIAPRPAGGVTVHCTVPA